MAGHGLRSGCADCTLNRREIAAPKFGMASVFRAGSISRLVLPVPLVYSAGRIGDYAFEPPRRCVNGLKNEPASDSFLPVVISVSFHSTVRVALMSSLDQTYAARAGAASIPLIVVACLFIASVMFVGVSGDFPLNDDWAYATAVRSLVWAHNWRAPDFATPNLLTQSLWAAPFCALSNCSFESLRLSTLAAMFLLAIFSYLLFGLARTASFVLVAALILVIFNPIGYELSYTLMTETFFGMAMTTSAYFLIRSLKEESAYLLALGTLAAIAAILCRQFGVCLPAGYLVARLLQDGSWARRSAYALPPVAICILVALGFAEWLQHTGRLSANYYIVSGWIRNGAAHGQLMLWFFRDLTQLLTYLGLFASPLLILTKPTDDILAGPRRWAPILVSSVFLMISVGEMIHHRAIMPISQNVLVPEGLGPVILRDTYILNLQDISPLPWSFWAGVTVLALFGQFVLIKRVASFLVGVWDRRDNFAIAPKDGGPIMAVATIAIYSAPIMLIPLFDRYFIPLLPLTFYWIIATGKPNNKGGVAPSVAGVIIFATVVFAILGTHDYLAWNRARWEAITKLEQSHQADYRTLDGGFEYNGLKGFDSGYVPPADKSWWWVRDDEYIIAFAPVQGYSTVARYFYTKFLPPERRAIFVLQRQSLTPALPGTSPSGNAPQRPNHL